MEKILYVELNIFAIFIILLLYINRVRTSYETFSDRIFRYMMLSVMLVLLFDSVMSAIDGENFLGARVINIICTTFYYCLNVIVPALWLFYCVSAIMEDRKKLIKLLKVYLIPFGIIILLIPLNTFFGFFFTIDAANVYHRGSAFLVPSAFLLLSMLYASALCIIAAKRTVVIRKKKQFLLLASLPVIPFIGGVLQAIFYGLSLTWLCVTLSIFITFLNYQHKQISTDGLTGLNNRMQFDRYLQMKISEVPKNRILVLAMIDINKFKHINDNYGHLAGDKALVYTAEILKISCKGMKAFISRYGGDEFTIICTFENKRKIKMLFDAIEYNIYLFNQTHIQPFILSVSMGYSICKSSNQYTADQLLQLADINMYHMKPKD